MEEMNSYTHDMKPWQSLVVKEDLHDGFMLVLVGRNYEVGIRVKYVPGDLR